MARARDLPKDFVLECPLTWRIWLIWGFTLHQERPRCSNSSDRDMVTTATNIAASAWVDERTSLQRWNLLLVNCNHAWSENEIRETAHRQQQPWRRWECDVINITVMTYIYGLTHNAACLHPVYLWVLFDFFTSGFLSLPPICSPGGPWPSPSV